MDTQSTATSDTNKRADLGLLTKAEVAQALRVSERTVQSYLSSKRIPVIRLSKRCFRFRLGDVEKALA